MTTKTLSEKEKQKTPSSKGLNQTVEGLQVEIERLHASRKFTENLEDIAKGASDLIFHKFLIPQGVSSDFDSEQYQQRYCEVLKTVMLISQSLSWSLAGGGKDLLDEYLLTGFSELLNALEHSSTWYVEALKYIKAHHSLTGETAHEMNTLIDHLINALTRAN